MTGVIYRLAPQSIVHSWVEVLYKDQWYNMEGFILDNQYLKKLQEKFSDCQTSFCGYGAATDNFQNPQVEWNVNDTYIQKEGINHDFGVFNSPDEFFEKYQQQLTPLKKWIYQNIARKLMNRNIEKFVMNPKNNLYILRTKINRLNHFYASILCRFKQPSSPF